MNFSNRFDPSEFRLPLLALSDALKRRKLILVLGAGVSKSAGLPLWNDLVEPMRSELGLPPRATDLDPRLDDPLYIAEIYEQTFGKPRLGTRVVEQLNKVGDPSPLHDTLARLDVPFVYTTNYDRLMETALTNAGKRYSVIFRDADYPYQGTDRDTTVVVKLHGDLGAPSEMVLTKSGVYDYPKSHANISAGFEDKLKTHLALFVGVSMLDPNLEGLFERALRGLVGHGLKHYILVKDWDPRLEQYYDLHYLVPVSLPSWDQIGPFLEEMTRRAAQGDEDMNSMPRGVTEVTGGLDQESRDLLFQEAASGLRKDFSELRDRFSKGARSSIKPELLDLWERIEKIRDDSLNKVKAGVALLIARLNIQTQGETDLDTAQDFISRAEQFADPSQQREVTLVRALCRHAAGKTDEALALITDLSGTEAFKVRTAFLLDSHKLDEARELFSQSMESLDGDEEWAWLRARYGLLQGDLESAQSALEGWLDKTNVSPTLLEAAGYIGARKAEKKQKEFCEKHSIFPNLSIILNHELLLDCHEGLRAGGHFEDAGDRFLEIDETIRAEACFTRAFELKQMCQVTKEELEPLVQKVLDNAPSPKDQGLSVFYDQRNAEILTIESFKKPLCESNYLPLLLNEIGEWATTAEAASQAAELLEQTEVIGRFDTLEAQVTLVATTSQLWETANRPDQALKVIDALALPADYAHYVIVLRAVHFLNTDQEAAAAKVIEQIPENLKEHPMILALLCLWHERKQSWDKVIDVAERLVGMIPTEQTFESYLNALGNIYKFSELLEALDRAESEGVQLGPLWTHVNRARALIALERYEEAKNLYDQAKELEKNGQISLGSQDLLHLVKTYGTLGMRSEAIIQARELIERYPDIPQGHLALAQLLMHENEPEEAFQVIEKAAQRFEMDETIQAEFINIGMLAGRTEAVADHLNTFYERFPDSTLVRRVREKDATGLLRQLHERADFANRAYARGQNLGMNVAYTAGGFASFFRFWRSRTRMQEGIYVACGEQLRDWKRLASEALRSRGAVFDFGSLIAAFELTKDFENWTALIGDIFPRIFLPASFRKLLVTEAHSLLGGIQRGKYKSLTEFRNILDWNRRFSPIESAGQEEDWVGEKAERAFAKKKSLLYLNEYGQEKDRIANEFGFQELAVRLSATSLLSPSQQRRLERLSSERKFRPLPSDRNALREIVADIPTLQTLHEAEILPAVLSFFERIHISEPAKRLFLREIATEEFSAETESEFRRFERWIKKLEGWVHWEEITDAERLSVSANRLAEVTGRIGEVFTYTADLLAVTLKNQCVLVTDDRFMRMAHFGPDRGTEVTHEVVKIGSDTLVRYLFHKSSNPISRDTYVELYRKLMQWSYRHLPLDAVVGMSLWAKGMSEIELASSSLMYFPRSMAEYLELAGEDPRLGRGILGNVINDYNEQFALMLHKAFSEGRSHEEAAQLIKELAMNFVSDRFEGRTPEYLMGFFNWAAIVSGKKVLSDRMKGTGQHFLQWLDESLLSAGLAERDIDAGWKGYIHQLLNIPVPRERANEVKKALAKNVAQILFELPDRTFRSVRDSHVGRILKETLNWDFEPDTAYVWPGSDETGRQEIVVTHKQINEVMAQHFVAIASGRVQKASGKGVKVHVRPRDEDSFYIVVDVLPDREDATIENFRAVSRVLPVIYLFFQPNKDQRLSAWERGDAKLRRFGCDLREWEELKRRLLSEDQREWREAAERCISILFSHAGVFATLISEAFTFGPDSVMELVEELQLKHVSRWFRFESLKWESAEELASWAEKICKGIPAGDEDGWSKVREYGFHSFFPDSEVFRTHFAQEVIRRVSPRVTGRRQHINARELKHLILDILAEAEGNPSPVFKINVVLTLIVVMMRMRENQPDVSWRQLWLATPKTEAAPSLRSRITSLLLSAMAASKPPDSALKKLEIEQLALSSAFSSALSTQWLADKKNGEKAPERRRYLACVAGGYLATELHKQHSKDEHTSHWQELREALMEVEELYRWVRVDTAPGFYRPSLADLLHYPAAQAMHALGGFTDVFTDYLMSDGLRKRLLDVAEFHRITHSALWTAYEADARWLDTSFEVTQSAGIHDFLVAVAGNSLKFWKSEDRRRLERLVEAVNPKEALEMFRIRTFEAPEKEAAQSAEILLKGIWLRSMSGQKGWKGLLENCLTAEFFDRLADLGMLYFLWMRSMTELLLTDRIAARTKKKIKRLLLRPLSNIRSPKMMEIHAHCIALLLVNERYDRFIEQWLRDVALDRSLPFATRREAFRVITRNLEEDPDKFSSKVKMRLLPLLREISRLPEWKVATEFMAFRGEDYAGDGSSNEEG